MKDFGNKKTLLENTSTIQIRPHFGYGDNNTKHYGLRALLNSNKKQAYGIELTKFKTNDDEFTAVGIILEQRLWEWFNMSIGTIGYMNYGLDNQNIFGVVSNLGWEPNNSIPFKPFVTFRNDIIFAKEKTQNIYSISFGFKFEF